MPESGLSFAAANSDKPFRGVIYTLRNRHVVERENVLKNFPAAKVSPDGGTNPACQLGHISPKGQNSKLKKSDLRGKGGTIRRERSLNLAMSITSAGWLRSRPHISPVAGEKKSGGERGKCSELSYKSLQNLRYLVAHTTIVFQSMITLTYPAEFPYDQATIKKHLDTFLKALDRAIKTELSYLWIMEFQRRGAPHYHVWINEALPVPLIEFKRKGKQSAIVNPDRQKWCSETWFRIVESNDMKHLRAGACWEAVRDVDGAKKYITKECSKKHQKTLPDGWTNAGRWWGASRDVKQNIPRPRELSAQECEKMFAALPENCINPFTNLPFKFIWEPPPIHNTK